MFSLFSNITDFFWSLTRNDGVDDQNGGQEMKLYFSDPIEEEKEEVMSSSLSFAQQLSMLRSKISERQNNLKNMDDGDEVSRACIEDEIRAIKQRMVDLVEEVINTAMTTTSTTPTTILKKDDVYPSESPIFENFPSSSWSVSPTPADWVIREYLQQKNAKKN